MDKLFTGGIASAAIAAGVANAMGTFGTAVAAANAAGVYGAAATSAALASLGGGSIAVGGAGMVGGIQALALSAAVPATLVAGAGYGTYRLYRYFSS